MVWSSMFFLRMFLIVSDFIFPEVVTRDSCFVNKLFTFICSLVAFILER